MSSHAHGDHAGIVRLDDLKVPVKGQGQICAQTVVIDVGVIQLTVHALLKLIRL